MPNKTSNDRTRTDAATGAGTRALPIALAALLGIFLVAGTGFAHTEAVHNAAHDTRHSLAFPCH